ncbi:MAG: glycosyltransferase [Phycisphaerales bacterium]
MPGRPLRILFFLQPGNTSRHAALDMIAGLQTAGHTVSVLELGPVWSRLEALGTRAAPERLALTQQVGGFLRSAQIDLSIAFWGNALTTLTHASSEGRATSCFDLWDAPHLMYWFDAPHWAQGGTVRQMTPTGLFGGRSLFSTVNNQGIADEMTGVLGFAHAAALPYAINERTFHPDPWLPAKDREFDIAIAAGPGDEPPTPLMLAELAREQPDCEAIRHEQAARVRADLATLATRLPSQHHAACAALLERLLATQLADPHTPVLTRLRAAVAADSGLSDASAALLADAGLWIDATHALRRVDSWRRAFHTAFMLRRFRCVLFGETGDALGPWGGTREATVLGYVPHEEQRRVYGRARLALSAMRWQDDVGLHLKPLEAGASGTMSICDWRSGLTQLLEAGTQVIATRSPGDMAREVACLLADPARIDTIAHAALTRIRREHTWKVRGEQMLDVVGGATGRW